MATVTIECQECETKFTISCKEPAAIQYCPFCAEPCAIPYDDTDEDDDDEPLLDDDDEEEY